MTAEEQHPRRVLSARFPLRAERHRTRITEPLGDRQEWRRLFSELLGTFVLVLAGRGGGKSGSGAAQGDLFTEGYESGKS